jgi:hypothetical protein
MTQTNIHRTIKHAAKKFLSTVHGRTRNKLRRGAKIVQKAEDAIIQGISLRAQKQTRHEQNRHVRNMEQVRIAGRMRKYINSAMMRNTAVEDCHHI